MSYFEGKTLAFLTIPPLSIDSIVQGKLDPRLRGKSKGMYSHYHFLVTGNNQAFGSPVNRIRITGYWASRSLTTVDHHASLRDRLRESWFHFVFRSTMFLLDGMFYWQMTVQSVRRVFGLKTENFEDELERMMQGVAKTNFGIEVSSSVFEG